ncbi:conserved hypothetical protein [Candidatus Desulfosporosinus infrequens]|uniref:DUF3006 domain-containing protein n=1 Tax=Candidatus Desulfosporosinus infrequens TaxID=2043169 RepID=A0A2U3KU44_9FIRM|nr:conserved hypothetical protein [Candidatus Desulfosporosinus infrequens]
MIVIVDRIENQFAVMEYPDRKTIDVPLKELPGDVKRGDCFKYIDEKFIPAPEETALRKAQIEEIFESLWEK